MSDLAQSYLPIEPALDDETAGAVRAFLRRLEGCYPVVEGICVRQPRRRSPSAGSDADLAMVLKGAHGGRTAAALDMAGVAFDVGVLVEALPLWDDEFNSPDSLGNPALIRAIQREGVRLTAWR